MASNIHYNSCPVCDSNQLQHVLTVKDQTVSKENFQVWECAACTLRFTQDVPDQNTIGPYYQSEDYISHSNTSKGFVNSLYLAVRKITLGNKRKLVQQITGLQKGSLLDVGSGTGAFVHEMKSNGWQVTGLEPDAGARINAKETFGVDLQDISNLYQLPAGSFDAITLWHVLEHVHDLHPYLRQLKKLLKPGGRLLIAVPNYTSADAAIYKEYWAAYDVPRHLYHFSPASMKHLVERNQMNIKTHKPMWFDSFYICLLSSKYKNGKTNLISAFLNGLWSNIKALGDTRKCSSVIYVITAN